MVFSKISIHRSRPTRYRDEGNASAGIKRPTRVDQAAGHHQLLDAADPQDAILLADHVKHAIIADDGSRMGARHRR